ncbi:sigma-70 family RNA polymerase sigma factor [Cupriavidus sp. AcVe19-6a]|uniref:sigma-70 family RNA polymerase sigma factor n=1 Tax=Cupriavidus sp. AcVe19-6a TaxID=2821358 RepID=UPI001AE4AECC|nr:sigma-70 family RNA polymerase sigma factor [Cupriavidus sp. AcVe19-6a]MBP0637993.1 sigma-70 family RNA polymerase sigma factor [Cupriavidus sp. AcVe19-6a]
MSAVPESEERLTKAEVEAALEAFQAAEWQRARYLAAAFCGGLTGWKPDDLLQEAMVKLLDGTRVWPRDVHPLVVLKNVLHSIASNERKHNDASPIDENVVLDAFEAEDDDHTPQAHGRVAVTPEDEASGKQQMVALYEALDGDADLELLAMAWADGIRGAEARDELGWDEKTYDAARKRLLRKLAAVDPDRRPK